MKRTHTDKHDVVAAVERVLDAVLETEESRILIEQFQWLLKVWNTNDDRCFEDFDPDKPYGARYDPDEDEDDDE
jgi:hypothetical protein